MRSPSRFLEPLERRELLSSAILRAATDVFAYPQFRLSPQTDDAVATPMGAPGPIGRTPAQIRKSYQMDNVVLGSIIGDGAGQTIAIISAYDNPGLVSDTDPNYAISDLHRFNVTFGLADPPSFKKVTSTGGTNYGATNLDWALESSLDVQWAHAMAPKANILLVQGNSNSLFHLNEAVNYAKALPGVSVISMSYGTGEIGSQTLMNPTFLTPPGHQGVTFIAASGDIGGVVIYPSSSTNVLAVGGTRLNQVDDSGTWLSETGWAGSGGGISRVELKPDYQQLLNTPSTTKRTTPDVAAVADPATGVSVVFSAPNGIGSVDPWYTRALGGTSLSAPLWAGMIAITNQARAMLGLGTLDGRNQTLPRLYSLSANDFHDVVTGNAGANVSGPGYDLVTGRGSPIAPTLIRNLAGGVNLSGTVHNDFNGNGTFDTGESGMDGITVYLDANNNAELDQYETSTITTASGTYAFLDLVAGVTYNIRQVLPVSTVSTSGASLSVPSSFGLSYRNNNFANFPTSFTGGEFTLRLDPTGTQTQIFLSATATGSPAYTVASSLIDTLSFLGTESNDTINIDLTYGVPMPSNGISFDGLAGDNTFCVSGSSANDSVEYSDEAIGFTDGGVASYLNVSQLNLALGTGNDLFQVLSGTFVSTSDLGVSTSNLTVDVQSGASVIFDETQHLAVLNIASSAFVSMSPNGNHVLRLSGLSVAASGNLDLNDNDLILDYSGSSQLSAVQALINNARNGGDWSGTGIDSSAAGANASGNTTLGALESSEYIALTGSTAFAGETVGASSILVKYTYHGDTDFSGSVDFDDYVRADAGFNSGLSGWANGDFDGNGFVDFDDYALLDLSFNTQSQIL